MMRKLFLWATAIVVVLAAGQGIWASGGAQPNGPAEPSLEGTWQVSLTYYYEGTENGFSENLQYLQQFHQDGRTVIYLPQNPEVDMWSDTRTACAGEWRRSGGRTFDVTLYCTWAETWTGAPTVPDRILMKVKMDRKGHAWTATPFYYQQVVNGEYTAGLGWGDMRGARLGIVPIQ
jgi:hypothetical protein